MKAKITFIPLIIGMVLLFASCSSPIVKYGDAQSATPVSTDFGSNDLQQIASKMVSSMLTFPPIVEETKNRRPVISVARVENRTMQHIDTQAITDQIRTKLIRSGKFRFTDKSTMQATIEDMKSDQESGMYDQNTVPQYGKNIAAEYQLVSSITEIKQKNNDVVDVYYKFNMSLKNKTTGILEWTDEKEIRKIMEY